MILGVDIGGTKVLIGAFDASGQIVKSLQFPTPPKYPDFLEALKTKVTELGDFKFDKVAAAVPARLDKKSGLAIAFGNLDWKNVSIQSDIQSKLGVPTLIENDAKMGALAAAHEIRAIDKKVLYVTIGTGIGTGLVVNGQLDEALVDSEGGQMMLNFEGKLMAWEKFASGKAIVERFGKKAADITEDKDWRAIAASLGMGIIDLCAVTQPDIVVIGGGVGNHFDHFGGYLKEYVAKNKNDLIKMPEIIAAKESEEAALKGCYIYATTAKG